MAHFIFRFGWQSYKKQNRLLRRSKLPSQRKPEYWEKLKWPQLKTKATYVLYWGLTFTLQVPQSGRNHASPSWWWRNLPLPFQTNDEGYIVIVQHFNCKTRFGRLPTIALNLYFYAIFGTIHARRAKTV